MTKRRMQKVKVTCLNRLKFQKNPFSKNSNFRQTFIVSCILFLKIKITTIIVSSSHNVHRKLLIREVIALDKDLLFYQYHLNQVVSTVNYTLALDVPKLLLLNATGTRGRRIGLDTQKPISRKANGNGFIDICGMCATWMHPLWSCNANRFLFHFRIGNYREAISLYRINNCCDLYKK